jgi:hypothetical protein
MRPATRPARHKETTMSTTYDLNVKRRPTTRTWLALGAATTAVAVLVMILVAAVSGAEDRTPPSAAGTPQPTASADPVEHSGDVADDTTGVPEQASTDGGHGGQDSGGTQPGGEDPEGDDTDEVHHVMPIPLTPTLSATVFQPKPVLKCMARGKITVGGFVIAPVEVEYQWIKIGMFGLANEPLSDVQKVVFDETGEKHVQVSLPASEVERAVQLRIYGDETIYSNLVAYPACG